MIKHNLVFQLYDPLFHHYYNIHYTDLYLEWSPDNTNWDISTRYEVLASVGYVAHENVQSRYFRVRLENNSGSDQTELRLHTLYNESVPQLSSITVDSEFPASATLTDAYATPETTVVGSFNMNYNGVSWDMVRGDTTNGLLVNIGSNNDVTVTGTVDLGAVDNAVLDSIQTNTSDCAINTNAIGVDTTSIDGKIVACDTGAVVVSSGSITAELGTTDNALLTNVDSSLTSVDTKITACNTGAVVVSSGSITADLGTTDNALLTNVDSS